MIDKKLSLISLTQYCEEIVTYTTKNKGPTLVGK